MIGTFQKFPMVEMPRIKPYLKFLISAECILQHSLRKRNSFSPKVARAAYNFGHKYFMLQILIFYDSKVAKIPRKIPLLRKKKRRGNVLNISRTHSFLYAFNIPREGSKLLPIIKIEFSRSAGRIWPKILRQK